MCQIPKAELELEDSELPSADLFKILAHHSRAHICRSVPYHPPRVSKDATQ